MPILSARIQSFRILINPAYDRYEPVPYGYAGCVLRRAVANNSPQPILELSTALAAITKPVVQYPIPVETRQAPAYSISL